MLEILETHGDDSLARVFVARLADGARVELVESTQPPFAREEKWILIISTLKGCPVGCAICDAGGDYRGRLSEAELFAQVDFLVRRRYPDGRVPVPHVKLQLARMGDPALNPEAVLGLLESLPGRLDIPGLLPSVSTVAPRGAEPFLDRLLELKRRRYPGGRFQLQLSLHATDEAARRRVVPIPALSFPTLGAIARRFVAPGDRKVTLNFAPLADLVLEPERLAADFPPASCLVKLTPVNPTFAARERGLRGAIDPARPAACAALADRFRAAGYETIVSIGELGENEIGSNCGMYVQRGARAASAAPVAS